METKRTVKGSLYFDGKVTVTDPCYNKKVWCRSDIEILPGTYECYVIECDDGVAAIGIVHENADYFDFVDCDFAEDVAEAGVDSGMCGFFRNKPDFDDEEWSDFCSAVRKGTNWMWNGKENDQYGWLSMSGYGDGGYPVFAHRDDNGVIDALEVQFIFDDDEEYGEEEDED